ncbi:MAG: homoserine dehydrogenase [Meiothermus sp.]
MERVNIALLGAGTVGGAFARLLGQHRERLAGLGLEVGLAKVLVRDTAKARAGIPPQRLTDQPEGLLDDADVLVEAMGGTGLAKRLVLQALGAGIPVITANKALLAEAWGELRPYADDGLLYYEASVMAATPVVAALSGVLWGSHLLELHAILNGTTNYILNRLEEGTSYAEALAEAQAKGYAEADPTLDVEGLDAAHKLTVLARLCLDPDYPWERVRANTRGITHLTPADLEAAREQGQTVRLVGSLYPENGEWKAAVRPVRLPLEHPLARAGSARNGLVLRGEACGELVFSGAGAGGAATASAVLGDLYQLLMGVPGPAPISSLTPVPDRPAERFEEV